MTEVEQAIADLDAALAADGERIELWRETGPQRIPFKVRCQPTTDQRRYVPIVLQKGIEGQRRA